MIAGDGLRRVMRACSACLDRREAVTRPPSGLNMPLALHPNPASAPVRRKTDHLVMNGQLEIGRIYKRDTLDKSDPQWLWAINGVPRATPGVMRVAGIAPSLEQAQAELQENWEKWLAWANLQELDTEELGAEGVGAETFV